MSNIEHLNDGSLIEVSESGQWDLCLPGGKHLRGRSENQGAAKAAAHAAHDAYVLRQWAKGGPIAGQRFIVPLR